MLLSSMLLAGTLSWGSFTTPLEAPAPRPIGSYSNGCIAGAVPLKLENPNYQVLRPQNRRYYGHPVLISFINDLAAKMNDGELADKRIILVGDMSMPRGGPFKGGHASHQIGLDVDIWFRMIKDNKRLTKEQLAKPWALPVVNDNLLSVNKNMDGYAYSLLRNAASDDRVERIFVSPAIKKFACEQTHPDEDGSERFVPGGGTPLISTSDLPALREHRTASARRTRPRETAAERRWIPGWRALSTRSRSLSRHPSRSPSPRRCCLRPASSCLTPAEADFDDGKTEARLFSGAFRNGRAFLYPDFPVRKKP